MFHRAISSFLFCFTFLFLSVLGLQNCLTQKTKTFPLIHLATETRFVAHTCAPPCCSVLPRLVCACARQVSISDVLPPRSPRPVTPSLRHLLRRKPPSPPTPPLPRAPPTPPPCDDEDDSAFVADDSVSGTLQRQRSNRVAPVGSRTRV